MKRSIHFSACACLILAVYALGRAQRPSLVVQTGHNDPIFSVAFSPDGKLLASFSQNGSVKLWDAATGAELRSIAGHKGRIHSITFSPDGKLLATGSEDKTIKLWDVVSGSEVRSFAGHSDKVVTVAFSPDGKLLASAGWETIKLWDVASGIELRSFVGHSDALVNEVTFSPDGKLLASTGEKTIKLWDITTGALRRSLIGHSRTISSIAFSPDGKVLAGAGWEEAIRRWDVVSGAQLKSLTGHTGTANSIAFSPDGKLLVSGGSDDTIKLWDVTDGSEIRSLVGHSSLIFSVAFSPDGKMLASASQDRTIKLWDVATGAQLRSLNSHSDTIRSVVFSPSGRLLAGGSSDKSIKLWDVATGGQVRSLAGHHSDVTTVAFSQDGKLLASAGWDYFIRLWDVASGKQLRTFQGKSYKVNSVVFSPDGKMLATAGSSEKSIILWDVASGTQLRALTRQSGSFDSIAFSPDGKLLAGVSAVKTIDIWDVATGVQLRSLVCSDFILSIAFSPDGRLLASGGSENTVKLWDVATGTQRRTLDGHSNWVNSVAFSPDGKVLASGSWDRTIRLWDVASGSQLKLLEDSSSSITSLSFSPDGKLLLSGSYDATVGLWKVSDGRLLASLVALDKDDWLVVTPDNLFDGSVAAWRRAIWRFDNNTLNYAPVEAYFNDFFYPGLLTEIFAGKNPRAPSDILRKDRRQPQLKLMLAGLHPDKALTARDVTVRLEVSQSPAGARDVRLFRNGSLVKVWHGDVLKRRRSVMLEATLPIVAGENRLSAYAFNRDNIKSSDATLVVRGAESLKRQGTAYILAVGINNYSNPQYDLKYAVADAQAFAEEVKRQQERLKNYSSVMVISLLDKEATKANILTRLAELSGRVQPEDALLVYFAGHGTAQRNRFYLIPHDLGYDGPRTKLDEAGLRAILAHSISDRELEQAFERIDTGHLLLVIDACNSGQALEAEEKRRGPMNSKGLAQLAYEKGMYIMTAAQSYQAAKEAARLGHGYLTYSLVIEGLKEGAADYEPRDGAVFIREWFDYATARVPQIQMEKLREARDLGENFSFIEGEGRNVDPEKREVQRPRVFYRREIETNPLIVARPQ